MRAVSVRMPATMRGRSSVCSAPPRSNSSAYAETAAIGVRSSCEASATNWRRWCSFSLRRASDASRASKAAWIRSSMTLRARASRPTSVAWSAPGYPLVEVPGGDGVGGGLDVLQRPQAEPDEPPTGGRARSTMAPAVTASSMRNRVCSVLVWSTRVCACTSTSPLKLPPTIFVARTRNAGPPEAMEPVVK